MLWKVFPHVCAGAAEGVTRAMSPGESSQVSVTEGARGIFVLCGALSCV